jgi:hypothetical protein
MLDMLRRGRATEVIFPLFLRKAFEAWSRDSKVLVGVAGLFGRCW